MDLAIIGLVVIGFLVLVYFLLKEDDELSPTNSSSSDAPVNNTDNSSSDAPVNNTLAWLYPGASREPETGFHPDNTYEEQINNSIPPPMPPIEPSFEQPPPMPPIEPSFEQPPPMPPIEPSFEQPPAQFLPMPPPPSAPEEPQASTYAFHPGEDSPGNDIRFVGGEGVSEDSMKQLCSLDDSCLGFNSNGWLKNTILPQDQWVQVPPPYNGLYVKQ